MPPAIALIAIGPASRWTPGLPIPLFLLWPFLALGLGSIRAAQWVRRGLGFGGCLERVRAALELVCLLRGLKVDVRSAEAGRVLIWFL